ncbi:MAG: hypothetical protein HYZ27_04970 [Deltaproteobacteria bacterium]|nr:hypothetical protein [Deltaproteobacteria bacterium]
MASARVAQAVRIAVYVMLIASAGAVFALGDRLWAAARGGSLPMWAALLPPCMFTLFVVVYAVDRWLLVKRRGYPTGRAFFQVAFALLFVTLLWPQQAAELQATRLSEPDRALRLLRHGEPEVRASMCELLALRAQLSAHDDIARLAATDRSPVVRTACATALERLEAMSGDLP